MGSYLFDEAQTAESRRLARTARRRIARIHERLMLLQSIFRGEIEKTDPTFFLRLNNSKLLPADKDERIATKYILFGDKEFNDKDYFKRYPTIFHLRKALIEAPPEDIRLLYLACHHIIKNRGHFLFEGQRFEDINDADVIDAVKSVNLCFAALYEDDEIGAPALDTGDIAQAVAVIKNTRMTKNDKQKMLERIFAAEKDSKLKEAVKAMTGGKFDVGKLYNIEECKIKTTFDNAAFDDTEMPRIAAEVGEDDIGLIEQLKKIYDFGKLASMLDGEKYLSIARVKKYDMHKADLALLKDFVRKYCPKEKYKEVFRHNDKIKNYAAYIGMDKNKSYAKAKRDEFYDYLKKNVFTVERLKQYTDELIAAGDSSPYTATAAQRFETGEFLPKQITSDNGVIPYQLHLKELEQILTRAAEAYPFLNEKSDGFTAADKIIKLMTFRVPYYVGPLGGGERAWAERNSGYERVKITPWNFDAAIDKDKSEERFITRMTSKCSYLPTEDVLPKNSLLYSEAIFLSELNNLRINGDKNDGIREIVYNYAKTHKKITKKAIVQELKRNGIILINGTADISGIGKEEEFATSLSPYITLRGVIGSKVDTARDACEDIIKWSTLFSDKGRLEARIKAEYGDIFTETEIKQLKGLTFSGWGNMSAKLLDGITSERSIGLAGERRTVIQTLRDEYINLTEALTAKEWGYDKAVDEYNIEAGVDAADRARKIDEMYCSPAVKRAIRRTLAIVDEIIKIQGHAPQKIFVEMARGATEEQKKQGRTDPRKKKITDKYKDIKADIKKWNKDIRMPDSVEERRFLSDKVYLYYMQMGKSMYSGKPIDFNRLFDTNVYDIDHIYPQSKINDDSLDNRVLVYKNENADKLDKYPLPAEIRREMATFWSMLAEKKLISGEKYRRLVRNTGLTADEMADFENRQLVAVRQSTKLVCSALKALYPETEIVYSKAKKASDFKDKFGLKKVRELNDLHHAKDAYINIVVGNTYNVRYGHDAHAYYAEHGESAKSDARIFDFPVKGAWDKSYIEKVAKVYNGNRCRVVRFVSEGSGQLFNATIKPKGANDNLIPLKENGKISDTSKYGGYDSATTAYFMLVKSKGKKDSVRLSLEAVTILADLKMRRDPGYIKTYLEEKKGLSCPEILLKKLRLNSLLKIDGSYAYIRGVTGDRIIYCNANELWIDSCMTDHDPAKREKFEPVPQSVEYLKRVASFAKKKKEQKDLTVEEEQDGITKEANIGLYDLLAEKLKGDIYNGLPMSGQAKVLDSENYRKLFAEMPVETQCVVLMKIVAFLACNSVNLDLSDFNGPKNAGVNLISKFIEGKDIKLITQSPTGHYRQEIDLDRLADGKK